MVKEIIGIVFVLLTFIPEGQVCGQSQGLDLSKKSFLRLYDDDGKKIGKGKIIQLLDSSLVMDRGLNGDTLPKAIPYSRIAFIRLKRSPSHYALVDGLLATALSIPIIAATTKVANDAFSPLNSSLGIPPEPTQYFPAVLVAGAVMAGLSAGYHALIQNKIQINHSGDLLREKLAQLDKKAR